MRFDLLVISEVLSAKGTTVLSDGSNRAFWHGVAGDEGWGSNKRAEVLRKHPEN